MPHCDCENTDMSTLHEIGNAVRVRRSEMGLTQDALARLSGLSRSTVNGVEKQSIGNLSISKAMALLESIGLSMHVAWSGTTAAPLHKMALPARSALERAAATASVSYKPVMTARQLKAALVAGEAPQGVRPHLQVLLDEAPVSLLAKVVDEIHTEDGIPKPRIWNQMRHLAHELQCFRPLWQ